MRLIAARIVLSFERAVHRLLTPRPTPLEEVERIVMRAAAALADRPTGPPRPLHSILAARGLRGAGVFLCDWAELLEQETAARMRGPAKPAEPPPGDLH